MKNWSNEALAKNIQKNIRALSVTVTDISLSVMDCDFEESKKMALWLISQSTGLNQMILEAERRGTGLTLPP